MHLPIAGIWYWFPFASRSSPHVVVSRTSSVKHTDGSMKAAFDVSRTSPVHLALKKLRFHNAQLLHVSLKCIIILVNTIFALLEPTPTCQPV